MPELPSGTVTFLITDIEGSTALWERDREWLRPALLRVNVKQPAERLGCLSVTSYDPMLTLGSKAGEYQLTAARHVDSGHRRAGLTNRRGCWCDS
jgi:hypothetical protein